MKVLAIVGSPRKIGNSDILAQTFLEGAASRGADTKKIFLAEKNIHQCQGCFRNCILKPGHRCAIHRDDMDTILDTMIQSDLILFVSPLYCATYSALMARFFERCLPLWEVEIVGELGTMDAFRFINNPLRDTSAVTALVQDFKNPEIGELAFKAYEHNVARTFMMTIVDTIHITDVRDKGDIAAKTKQLDAVRKKGAALVR